MPLWLTSIICIEIIGENIPTLRPPSSHNPAKSRFLEPSKDDSQQLHNLSKPMFILGL